MSRIGKQPIEIPSGVTVDIKEGVVVVRGANGELTEKILPGITVEVKENQVIVTPQNDEKETRSFHGLQRSLIANMIIGLSEGFKKVLELHGVGFRVAMSGAGLKLSVGFSHDVDFALPEGVKAEVNGNEITISGASKQLVGQVAAEIRKIRKPEPYKGKGIRYKDEYIVRKAGKTASA